ncbi:hypothetical protein WJX74_005810 [Apatococcus lobatus]|uniref:Uncharacterized protein n=1 Tax=Apatococcus lobatus TaxID=904363 RepID=A0AAW1RSR2_9CHLO
MVQPNTLVQAPIDLHWPVGQPETEYIREYPERHGQLQSKRCPAAGCGCSWCKGHSQSGRPRDLSAAETSRQNFLQRTCVRAGPRTSNKIDFPPKPLAAAAQRRCVQPPLPARNAPYETSYHTAYTGKAGRSTKADANKNINIQKNWYDPNEHVWFGESHVKADYPDWGKVEQAPQNQRQRPIGRQPAFTSTTNYQKDFQKPGRYAKRVTKMEGLVSSMPIAAETVYRHDYNSIPSAAASEARAAAAVAQLDALSAAAAEARFQPTAPAAARPLPLQDSVHPAVAARIDHIQNFAGQQEGPFRAGKRMLPNAMAHKSSNPILTAEQFDDHTCYNTEYTRPAQL